MASPSYNQEQKELRAANASIKAVARWANLCEGEQKLSNMAQLDEVLATLRRLRRQDNEGRKAREDKGVA